MEWVLDPSDPFAKRHLDFTRAVYLSEVEEEKILVGETYNPKGVKAKWPIFIMLNNRKLPFLVTVPSAAISQNRTLIQV